MRTLLISVAALASTHAAIAQPVTRTDTYYSQAEGRKQSFQVVLPEDYATDVKYPLFVQVFGSASLMPSKEYPFIRIRPSGRGVWAFRAMSRYDVLQAISATKQKYNIDEDRIYMSGASAGATGMMHAAALRQDLFAGLVPLVAFGNDLPLENFRNLPVRCEHGQNDWTSSICNVRAQFLKLKDLGYDAVLNEHPKAGHGVSRPPAKTMKWLFAQNRNRSPKQIVHRCEHTRDGKAYWLTIESFADPHKIARIEASAADTGLSLMTDNVRQFSLDVETLPSDLGPTLKIDGRSVKVTQGNATGRLTFRRNTDWALTPTATEVKGQRRSYGAGAAANLFQGEPLLVIYGTGGSKPENQFLRQTANVLARCGGSHWRSAGVRFPVKSDTELEDVPLEKYNLLLVGTPENNSYLQQIAPELPFEIKDRELSAGNRERHSLNGTVLSAHYYNPRHPRRLIYVVSPYLNASEQVPFLKNPRKFLVGSDGFKMIDQPDLRVRGADLKIHREMQLGADWKFIELDGADKQIPQEYSNRDNLARAHMQVMHQATKADFALWWGPEDKGSFGGYDFNWLPTFHPATYTKADYLIRRRETECLTATLTGTEILDFSKRWIGKDELLTYPTTKNSEIEANRKYRVVLPMDLVVKLGTRRKVLSDVAPGPGIMPDDVASMIWKQSVNSGN